MRETKKCTWALGAGSCWSIHLIWMVTVILLSCACSRRTEVPTANKPIDLPRCTRRASADLETKNPKMASYKAALWSFYDLQWDILKSDDEQGAVLAKVCRLGREENDCLEMTAQALADGKLRVEIVSVDMDVGDFYMHRWLAYFKQRFARSSCMVEKHLDAKLSVTGFDFTPAPGSKPAQVEAEAPRNPAPEIDACPECPPCRCICVITLDETDGPKASGGLAPEQKESLPPSGTCPNCPPCQCTCVISPENL